MNVEFDDDNNNNITGRNVSSFQQLLADLRQIFDGDSVNVDLVKDVLRNYKSSESDWEKYAMFDAYK